MIPLSAIVLLFLMLFISIICEIITDAGYLIGLPFNNAIDCSVYQRPLVSLAEFVNEVVPDRQLLEILDEYRDKQV